jgi:hypothetical protein
MHVHNAAAVLDEATFPTSWRMAKTPEGYHLGGGKTVGNGVENWAPNALFIHSDGGASARQYRNTGTSTTATWTADGTVAAGETFDLKDASKLNFGTGLDIEVEWNGTYLESGPPSGLWTGCPSPLDPDPFKAIVLFDDFLTGVDAGTHWISLDDGATGTNTYGDQLGGSLNVVTAAADNDYHAMQSTAECFDFAGRNELWFEARFRLVEATTNESAWWFGLSNTDTTGGLQANAAGPLASYDGVLVWKDEATMAIDVETSNAGTQDTETNIATFVTNTWTRVGFHVSSAATTAVCTAYYDVAAGSGALTAHGTTMNITRSGMEPMHAIFGVKAGPTAAAETLEVDYIKCVQLRTAAS